MKQSIAVAHKLATFIYLQRLTLCRQARSLSEAGRQLFSVSRTKRSVINDTDRLRKYLARFDLDWKDVVGDA